MKYLLSIILCIILIQGFAQEASEQMFIQLEERRLNAIIAKDSSTLMKIYDDHYQGVLASGQSVDKAKHIEFHLSGSPHIGITNEDVKASVFGNLAITTGKQLNKSKSGHVIGQSKFIRIYQRKGDKWTIIKSQGTIVVHE